MNEIHREILRRRHLYLHENIIMEEGLISALQEKGVFTKTMAEALLRKPRVRMGVVRPQSLPASRLKAETGKESGQDRQLNKLLDMLPKRGPRAFESFLEVLKADYSWVVDSLRQLEEELKSKDNLEVPLEVRRVAREYIRELTRITRINPAQQKVVEEFLCRHIPEDTVSVLRDTGSMPAPNQLYTLHKQLLSCIQVNSLPETDQMELKCTPETVNMNILEKDVSFIKQRLTDLQTTVDHCYATLGAKNKEKDLADIVYSLRTKYLEKDIKIEELKSEVMQRIKQLRVAKDRAKKLQEATARQEEEKEELSNSLDGLKQKIQKLQEERQKIGMRKPFDPTNRPLDLISRASTPPTVRREKPYD